MRLVVVSRNVESAGRANAVDEANGEAEGELNSIPGKPKDIDGAVVANVVGGRLCYGWKSAQGLPKRRRQSRKTRLCVSLFARGNLAREWVRALE